jgi:3-isopropylmalate/(R)-2-methylmalate dehydratase small subunit
MMEKFTRIAGIAAAFPKANIDTDAIIPAQWLRSLSTDLGKGLFAGSRYDRDGNENPEFILNRAPYRDAKIIVAGPNFACGSSREGAVWALQRFGIRCVIAPGFSDIFFENAFKNGLLPVILPERDVQELLGFLETTNDPVLTVDLDRCVIETPQGRVISFTIPEARRKALLEGLDEIGQTLHHEAEIAAFQARDREARPWIHRRERGLVAKARG